MYLSYFWDLFDKKVKPNHMYLGRNHHEHKSNRRIKLITRAVHILFARSIPEVPIIVVLELCLASVISVSGVH